MTKVISTINLKGGVGKTTITVALAEFLAQEENRKVLLIDLDPQTNATVSLIGDNEWKKKNEEGKTLYHLFPFGQYWKLPNIRDFIIKGVSTIAGGIDNLHLLPSSIDLIQLQDELPPFKQGGFYMDQVVSVLNNAILKHLDEYDIVLIDCPPNLSTLTLNGLYISDYYLIPVIPDILSTYGIPQILDRVKDFKKNSKSPKKIEDIGIIISMYRSATKLHNETIERLKDKSLNGEYPRIFKTIIPLAIKTAESADFELSPNTLKQKYGGGQAYENYLTLTKEFLEYV